MLTNAGALVPELPELLVPRAADRFDDGTPRDDALADDLRRLLAALAEAARERQRDETRAA